VFPRGRPADTAGFADDPAATQSSVANLSERLNSLERQLAEILRQTEENGNRIQTVEAEFGRARTEQDRRLRELETFVASAAAQPQPQPVITQPAPGTPNATVRPPATSTPTPSTNGPAIAAADPGEDAYSEGFRLWQAGQHAQAITALRAFTSAFPRHRRVSWANNLVGRAMLDQGQPRAAAEALLANYRSNPRGERAPDSLYYLGQALLKLGQPTQACNAYAELEEVYGARLRDELKRMIPGAKAEAQCK
jgi:TolA-binding protein